MHRIVFAVARAEGLKLKRRSLLFPLMGGTTLVTALLLVLYFAHAGKKAELIPINTGFNMIQFFVGVIAICISASYVAGEYTYGTLRSLLVRAPSRIGVVLGKFLAHTLFFTLLITYLYLTSTLISFATTTPRQRSIWLHASPITHSILGLLASIAGTLTFALFGFCLGLIFRSPMIAISVGILWSLIIESAIGGALPKLNHWLPAANFENLAQGGSASFSLLHSSGVALLYLAALCTPALYLFLKRDV